MAPLTLPDGVRLVRTTDEFTAETVPPALLRAHRIAPGVWGLLRVLEGRVTFVVEESDTTRELGPGETQVIEPEVVHHVAPGAGARFVVEFHR